jgi:hypothetical protein
MYYWCMFLISFGFAAAIWAAIIVAKAPVPFTDGRNSRGTDGEGHN